MKATWGWWLEAEHVSHIIWTPRKEERKGAGEREEKWNKNILLTWKLYQKLRLLQALPPNPSCHYHTFPLYLFPHLQKEPKTAISGCSLVPKLFKSSHLLTMYTNKRGENESKTHPQGPPFNSPEFLVNCLPVSPTGTLEIPAMMTALIPNIWGF